MRDLNKFLNHINAHAAKAAEEKAGASAALACRTHLRDAAIRCKDAEGAALVVDSIEYDAYNGYAVIVFTDGRYIHLEARRYDEAVGLTDDSELDLEIAHELGVLPDILYAPVRKAREANQEYRRTKDAVERLRQAAEELGPDIVKDVLNDVRI